MKFSMYSSIPMDILTDIIANSLDGIICLYYNTLCMSCNDNTWFIHASIQTSDTKYYYYLFYRHR